MSSVAQATREQADRRRAQVVGISQRLVAQAEQTLRRRLAEHPRDAAVWRRLADTQRMLGRFADARESYRRSLALAPDAAASWADSVLAPAALPAPPAGQRAVPFAQIADFLSPAERRRLWAATLAGSYRPARIDRGTTDSSRRDAAVVKPPTQGAVRRWFVPKLHAALAVALARLGADSRGLNADNAEDYGFELQVTAHHAGGYYTCHADNRSGISRARRLSYVYYFHRMPRRFAGGDLLLYDTDYDAQEDTHLHAYSRLSPADNTLVLFPSDSYHEITKVAPASGETLAFGDGRFTVNGWIRATKQAPTPDQTPD